MGVRYNCDKTKQRNGRMGQKPGGAEPGSRAEKAGAEGGGGAEGAAGNGGTRGADGQRRGVRKQAIESTSDP